MAALPNKACRRRPFLGSSSLSWVARPRAFASGSARWARRGLWLTGRSRAAKRGWFQIVVVATCVGLTEIPVLGGVALPAIQHAILRNGSIGIDLNADVSRASITELISPCQLDKSKPLAPKVHSLSGYVERQRDDHGLIWWQHGLTGGGSDVRSNDWVRSKGGKILRDLQGPGNLERWRFPEVPDRRLSRT